jgi:hypothetical protein
VSRIDDTSICQYTQTQKSVNSFTHFPSTGASVGEIFGEQLWAMELAGKGQRGSFCVAGIARLLRPGRN